MCETRISLERRATIFDDHCIEKVIHSQLQIALRLFLESVLSLSSQVIVGQYDTSCFEGVLEDLVV